MRFIFVIAVVFISIQSRALNYDETVKAEAKCKKNKTAAVCFELGQDYYESEGSNAIDGLKMIADLCQAKNKKACNYLSKRVAELDVAKAECVDKKIYKYCERLQYQCEKIGVPEMCMQLANYWANQHDIFMFKVFSEKACSLGAKIACTKVTETTELEEGISLKKDVDLQNQRVSENNKRQNLVNGLQMLNGFVNQSQPSQPTQTNCETKPVYGMDGHLIKYNTVCK